MNKSNIIILFPDQWRSDALGFLNHPVVDTPFLDHLAGEGVCFTNAYSACPSCISARASLATGLTPSSTGRLGYQDGVIWNYPLTYMKYLRDNGYQTMVSGKTHFYPQRISLGFEQMALYESQIHENEASDYHIWLSRENNHAYTDLSREIDPNGMYVKPWTYQEYQHPNSWTTDRALDMLTLRDPTRPFLLHINYQRPHTPLDPPIDFWNRYKDREIPEPSEGTWSEKFRYNRLNTSHYVTTRVLKDAVRGYFAQLAHIDYQIGRVLNYLREKKAFRKYLDNIRF
jgi:arylsulfatase